MKITIPLLRKPGRRMAKEPFKFHERMPLMLKNSVSGKSEKTANVACLQEMQIMFACMKNSEFKEAPCSKEIEAFQQCYVTAEAVKKEAKKRSETGQAVPGSRDLTSPQVNKLLARFPQVNERKMK